MRKRTVLLLGLSGSLAIAAAAAFMAIPPENTVDANTLVVVSNAPDNMTIEGDGTQGTVLSALLSQRQSGQIALTSSSATLSHVTLRLMRDEPAQFLDIHADRTLSFSGFEPRTRVQVKGATRTYYDGIPMDWNGRISLDTPTAQDFPLWITFPQSPYTFEIGLIKPSGGAT